MADVSQLKFLQIKLPAIVTPPENPAFVSKKTNFTRAKHPPHLTFFEFKVHPSLLDRATKWFLDHSVEIEGICSQLVFDTWHIFYKKKFHVAVLAPSSDTPWLGGAISQRERLLLQLFRDFDCNDKPVASEKDGFPIWLLYDSHGELCFSTSLYHRPEIWDPHITIAMKFRNLEEKHDNKFFEESRVAVIDPGKLWYQVLEKD